MSIKKTIQYGLMTLVMTCPSHVICMEYNQKIESGKTSSHDYKRLENESPKHFAGFQETPFQLIEQVKNHLRSGKKITDPMDGMKEHLSKLSRQLELWDDFSHIRKDIDKQIKTQETISPATYTYYIWRIAVSQGSGVEKESSFFKAAGFSKPYDDIFKIDMAEFSKKEPSNVQEFLSLLGKLDDLDDFTKGDYSKSYYRSYSDENDTVKNKYVKKNPYAKTPFFLPGSDILGYFYLAMTYAQGIHPIPVPFDNNMSSDLHGIPMSRWAKYCHDNAHSEADLGNYSAEQFAYNLINRYIAVLLSTGKEKLTTLEERKKHSVESMVPHFANFATKVHEAYRASLVAILERSLGMIGKNDEGFEAFSVSAFLHLHESPLDLSRKYGTSQLKDLLTAANPEKPLANSKEEDVREKKEDVIETENVEKEEKVTDNRFETSYTTGRSQLSDEQIFNLVKKKQRSDFLGQYSLVPYRFDPEEISDYKVTRNDFYIEVALKMLTGEELIYRQNTNYSSLLNFDHDFSMLETAKTILKKEYNYDLPRIPNPKEYKDEKEFERDAKKCREALNMGFVHLMDIWEKNSIELSQHKLNNSEQSIAERFEDKIKEALGQLRFALPEWAGNLDDFIRDAVTPQKM